MIKLLLVRHAPTASTRRARFAADERLDAAAAECAARLRPFLRRADLAASGPAACAVDTARAIGVEARVEDRLADCDFGSWAGKAFADVEPGRLAEWMRDPDARPHGGESISAMTMRVGSFLDEVRGAQGVCVAVTHAGPVRAAVMLALGTAPDAFWRIDVDPLSVTEIHSHPAGWRLVRTNWTMP